MSQRRLSLIALVTSIVVVAALPWILRASQRGLEDFHNVPYLWVSEDFEPRRQFDQFLQRFAHSEMIVLSYEGCTVDDPRLQRFAERLTSDTASANGHAYQQLFPDVSTGYGALRALQEPPLELSRAAALQRLQGILVGPDGETSCALITVSQQGIALRAQLPEIIREAAAQSIGLPPDEFILAGGLLEGIEIDAESGFREFLGRSLATVTARLEETHGLRLDAAALERMRRELHETFRRELTPTRFVTETLDRLQVPFCVASSSQKERIGLSLGVTGLLERFAPHVFSAELVSRGKPAPDLFLHVAEAMGVPLASVAGPVVALTELVGGAALVLGLFTRPAGFALAVVMAVATLMVHLPAGFFLPAGLEFTLTLGAGALALALAGPGAHSLDAVRARSSSPSV